MRRYTCRTFLNLLFSRRNKFQSHCFVLVRYSFHSAHFFFSHFRSTALFSRVFFSSHFFFNLLAISSYFSCLFLLFFISLHCVQYIYSFCSCYYYAIAVTVSVCVRVWFLGLGFFFHISRCFLLLLISTFFNCMNFSESIQNIEAKLQGIFMYPSKIKSPA